MFFRNFALESIMRLLNFLQQQLLTLRSIFSLISKNFKRCSTKDILFVWFILNKGIKKLKHTQLAGFLSGSSTLNFDLSSALFNALFVKTICIQ